MTQGEITAGTPPEWERFGGTEVPKLTMEQDEPWLTMLMPLGRDVDDKLLENLNELTEISGDTTLLRQGVKHNPTSYSRNVHAELKATKLQFHRLIGAESKDSPLNNILQYIQGTALSTLVSSLRLIYSQTGERFPAVIEDSHNLLTYRTDTLRDRFEFASNNGFDVGFLLVVSPDTFTNAAARKGGSAFLTMLQRVGSGHNKSNYQKRIDTLKPVEVRHIASSQNVSVEIQERYVMLAGLSGIDSDLLQAGLPQVQIMGSDEVVSFTARVEQLAEVTEGELSLRSLMRLLNATAVEN